MDIERVAKQAHEHGIIVVVDNTFVSPFVQNPLDHGGWSENPMLPNKSSTNKRLGADMVVHSGTKYINGHADLMMGVIATSSESLRDQITFLQNAAGAIPSPFDCWLAHRGLKTLHLRAAAASHNAMVIATALQESPYVIEVLYPGLESHPQRALVLKQHRDGLGGGVLSFRIRGGPEAAVEFCRALRLFTIAESFGGVQSLVEVPRAMTHSILPEEIQPIVYLPDDLVRVGCGIENALDLKADVLSALERVVGPLMEDDAS